MRGSRDRLVVAGSRLSGQFARVAQQVSTRPTGSSYIWGGRRSPLAFTVFHVFFLVRLFSPLQWLKYWVRRRGAAKPPTTNMRPDFPAAYTEWYFIAMLAIAGVSYVMRRALRPHLPWQVATPLEIAGWLMISECVIWVLYYLMLRAFVERYYTIFHPAEYVLMFPLMVAVQTLLVADVTGRSIVGMLQAFIGNPTAGDGFETTLAVLGYLYLGVAITVVLSTHPGIAARHAQTITVLGAGDVTIHRILPALKVLGYERGDIVIASVNDPETTAASAAIGVDAKLRIIDASKVLEAALREHSPTVIASPTHAHFPQLVALASAGIPFAVEKPIVAARPERELLRAQGDQLMAKGFALSYYSLEKALPLTYFLGPIPVYAGFLAASDPGLLDGQDLHHLRDALGALRSVRVDLLEGASRSPSGSGRLWTELPGTLRPFIETTIHPLLIMRHVTGPGPVTWQQCAIGRYTPRAEQVRAEHGREIAPTWLEAVGAHGSARVSMLVAKHVPDEQARRVAVIEYERGTLTCDFDERRLDIMVTGQRHEWIAIDRDRAAGRYRQNYAVQMQMFMEFAINGWRAIRFDDFARQLDALDAWDDLCDAVERDSISVVGYTTESITAATPPLRALTSSAPPPLPEPL
jgi:predicted dehydrogenase